MINPGCAGIVARPLPERGFGKQGQGGLGRAGFRGIGRKLIGGSDLRSRFQIRQQQFKIGRLGGFASLRLHIKIVGAGHGSQNGKDERKYSNPMASPERDHALVAIVLVNFAKDIRIRHSEDYNTAAMAAALCALEVVERGYQSAQGRSSAAILSRSLTMALYTTVCICASFTKQPQSRASMCTIIVLNRPDHDWPVLIAANRDERLDRAWNPPGPHWPDRPEIVAGQDAQAGGSWMGINATGVVAAVLNRLDALGPEPGKRSRGELTLDALDYNDAVDAAEALRTIAPRAYRPFNLVIADNRDAFVLVHRNSASGAPVTVERLPAGLSMITAMDRDDQGSPRIRLYRPRFLAAPAPDPDSGDWSSWEGLLGSREREPESGPGGAMFIDGAPAGDPSRFGTVSSSLVALPSIAKAGVRAVWRFASGVPEAWSWKEIACP